MIENAIATEFNAGLDKFGPRIDLSSFGGGTLRDAWASRPGIRQSVLLAEIGIVAFAAHPIARMASLLRYVADADRVRAAAAALVSNLA